MKFALSLILTLTLAVTASAGHGRQQVVVQRQRVVVQQVRVRPQRVVQQFVAPQQFNAGCHQNGVLQFNAGSCSALYR